VVGQKLNMGVCLSHEMTAEIGLPKLVKLKNRTIRSESILIKTDCGSCGLVNMKILEILIV